MTEHDDTEPGNTEPGVTGPDDSASSPPLPPPPVPGTPPPPVDDTAPPRVALGADGAVTVPAAAAPVPFWQRVPKRLLIGGVVVLVIVVVGWLAGRGKTDATDLQAGDCFEAPSGNDIRDVKDQSCDGLHDVEILAVTSLPAGTPWPGLDPFAIGDTPAAIACFDAVDLDLVDFDNVPNDIQEGHFFPDQSAWNDGDRKILCYAQSATGFPGPVMIRE